MTSKLDQLRTMTTVVADTGDIEAIRRLKPIDCTTNPSIVLKVAQLPASKGFFDEAVQWGCKQSGTKEAVIKAIADRMAVSVGVALAREVPGRVSTEVDADLSFDIEASVSRARQIIADYRQRGVERDRILIKLAATWEGIQAARILQKEGVDCNLTLIFSLSQAIACANAGVFLISPFVGRILDWHVKARGRNFEAQEDPGVLSVRAIYDYYKSTGANTIVMGASFRNLGEIEALAGCDRLTIAPALLQELDNSSGKLVRQLSPETVCRVPAIEFDEPRFRWALNEDAVATEKLAEGIRLFAKDLHALRAMARSWMEQAA